ncbi:hypothetical protein CDCA_CDCA07G2171 [Cyanidium caldarium]|uniref:C-CAP/cofactor C-like domain-containing protein n=1 Tax=Cyanidium caldarium TaxID=2771 RepID=A0AAV9IVM3_CYACA|nr:hypothetical protein CDCA_CDCA07G2171 [Cyanidium caldarium]
MEERLRGPLEALLSRVPPEGEASATVEVVRALERAAQCQSAFLEAAAGRTAPVNTAELVSLLEPTVAALDTVERYRRESAGATAVAEAAEALRWVAATGQLPGEFIAQVQQSTEYHLLRLPGEWRPFGESVRQWLQALREYVVGRYGEGLMWGGVANEAPSGEANRSAPPPPAPPPLPPRGWMEADADDRRQPVPKPSDDAGGSREALFAEINAAGESITSTLRRTGERATPTAPPRPTPAPTKSASSSSSTRAVTPVLTLDAAAHRWRVERLTEAAAAAQPHHIRITHPRQTVYLYHCSGVDVVVDVSGKCNSVVVDSCQHIGLVLDDVVSGVEFIRSQNCRLQIRGRVPSLSVDQTAGLTVIGAPEQIVTCCATALCVVEADGEEDHETPIPEQFITTREPVQHAGRQPGGDKESVVRYRWVTRPLQHNAAA